MIKKTYLYIIIAAALIIIAGIYVDNSTKIHIGNITPSFDFENYGQAPDFKKDNNWLNSKPLTMADLKGKVVLVDFWTYSCINCIRTLPYITKWHEIYKDKGLVIIGVHTPEFAFERDTGNVKKAIENFNIHYAVVQDNDYGIWNSYNNHYWPAKYLINKDGEIVYKHFGEGKYEETENNIRQLLGLESVKLEEDYMEKLYRVASPEMYLGTWRLANLTRNQAPSAKPKNYTINRNLELNKFSLGGNWQFLENNVLLAGDNGQINLKFHSGKLYIVASSQIPATLKIIVDGVQQPDVKVQDSKLYTLFDSEDYTEHVIEIYINQKNFEAFTFTFG